MHSSWPSSVFRHVTLTCRTFKHQHSPASRLFSSTKFSQAARAETIPLLSSSSDFAHLAGRGQFVDKSSALQDFLTEDTPIHLLLRPRRSGKTTILRMFRDFFQWARPEEGARRKDLFIKNNLAITKDARFENEFGQYPVLYLDFSIPIGTTMAKLLQNFRYHVTTTVLRLEDMGLFHNREELPENQRAFLDAVRKGTVPDSELVDILFKLTEVLHTLHQKKVIVLIDEYDSAIAYAVEEGYFHEANDFFRKVFSTLLKNNEHIRGALMVGILNVARAGWFSGINNVSVYPLGHSTEYSTSCMFTEDEIRTLYGRQVEIQKPPFEFDDLKKWYNGYSTANGTKLYNPWSVVNALTKGRLATWWNKSGYDKTIQACVVGLLGSDYEFRAQCQTLLDGKAINIKIDDIGYSSVPNMSRDQLFTLMYYAGYLTTSDISMRASVHIPNAEIQCEFREWIEEDFYSRMSPQLSETSVGQFNLMVNGSFAEFAESFGKFFFTEAPQRTFGGLGSAYQEYVYVYFSSAARALDVRPKWVMKMEVPAGVGRLDIVLYRDVGVVIEVKCFPYDKKEGYRDKERRQLSCGSKEALMQCDTRHYRSVMPEHMNTVYEYGLAFLGPYCAVEARALNKVNGMWVTGHVYTAHEDEIRRERTYCTDGLISDDSTTSKKGCDRLMVATNAITARNLYAKFHLEKYAPTVAEFADVWKSLDRKTVEAWETKARQMKKMQKEKKMGKELAG